jgi:uncharacterized membrane protein
MSRLVAFLTTTTVSGLFVLLPVALVYLLLGETMGIAVAVATPIADLFPGLVGDNPRFPSFLAVALILATSFALGVVMLAGGARRVGTAFERRVLMPLPGYAAIKQLTRSMAGDDGAETAFKPALLVSPTGQKELAYWIEEHADSTVTVMVPWAPNPMAGSVRIVPREQVQLLDVRFADLTAVLSYWGVGSRALLEKHAART